VLAVQAASVTLGGDLSAPVAAAAERAAALLRAALAAAPKGASGA